MATTVKDEAVNRVAEQPDAKPQPNGPKGNKAVAGENGFPEQPSKNDDPIYQEMNGLVETARANVNVVDASEQTLLTISRLIRGIKGPDDVTALADAVERTASRFGYAVAEGTYAQEAGQTRVVGRV
jgi:hypothetical protein